LRLQGKGKTEKHRHQIFSYNFFHIFIKCKIYPQQAVKHKKENTSEGKMNKKFHRLIFQAAINNLGFVSRFWAPLSVPYPALNNYDNIPII